jgi:hypothetical protein
MSLAAPLLEQLEALRRLLAQGGPADGLAAAARGLEAELAALRERTEPLFFQLRDGLQAADFLPGLRALRSFVRNFRVLNRDVYRAAAEALLASGRPAAALDVLAALLASLPDGAAAHGLLAREELWPAELRGRALGLARERRFAALPGVAGWGLDYPFAVAVDPAAGRLYVSDHRSAAIHRFGLDGADLGPLRGPWRGLMGLCLDDRGLLWACDYADQVLYALDREGRVQERVALAALLGPGEASLRPEYLCASGGLLYLLSCTPQRRDTRLWSFDPREPAASLRRFPVPPLGAPAGVQVCGGRILAAGGQPATILALDADSGRPLALVHPPCLDIYQIAAAPGAIYVTHLEGLLKLDPDGRPLFDVDLARIAGGKALAQGLALVREDGGPGLLLADFAERRLLRFGV